VPLVRSLLTAIVRADGDALVLHAGERPYIVTPTGQPELTSRVLTLEAMTGMLGELLPGDARKTLDDVGAVQHDLSRSDVFPEERFTIVAARGGDDIWIEIRRHRLPKAERAPEVKHAPEVRRAAEVQLPPVQQIAEPDEEVEGDTVYELSLDDMSASPMRQPEPSQEPEPAPHVVRPEQPRATSEVRMPRPVMPEPEPQTAVVLPIARNNARSEQSARPPAVRTTQPLHAAGIDRLLRIAAARGASTLYLTSQSRPSIRVDGEISAIEGEPVLSEPEVEALMLDIIPERNRETLRSQAGTEWMCDVPDVGRIRCVTFRDHRGAGGIFRMIPVRAISADQIGLSREIQGLCAEAEGLVLVTGPRSSGKSTLISAFVDLINRTRSDHVITLENQVKFVHENRGSLVSQREVRGDNNELISVARAALRENPDVLVIEDFGSPEVVTLALEAAQSGHLIIGALTAHTTTDAVDRIIDQTPPERRPKVQLGLAENLRGIVAQVLLRKTGGGRVAAREVLLNTSAVANLIAEGKTSQLRTAIDSGRKHGMVPLNDALVAFVEGGIVDSREAYRQTADKPGFLALLKRQGIDTSFVERLA
jgi:twitching motility protein PilT